MSWVGTPLMLRGLACLLSVWLVASCSSGVDKANSELSGVRTPGTAVDDEWAQLLDALSGLCQARQQAVTDQRAAKATYDRRSRHGIDTTARLLQPSYSQTAAVLTKAAEQVQADLATEPASATVATIADFRQRRLADPGIPTSP